MKMALVELLQASEIESNESVNVTANFITNTIRSIFLTASSAAAGKENENDRRLKQITLDEVSDHYCHDDCWIIIYDRIYDITKLLRSHPGGDSVLLEYAGRDGTEAFRGHSADAVLSMKEYEIGVLPPHQRIYRYPGMIRISEPKPE